MKATIRAAGRLALAATLLLLSWTGPLFALNNGAPVAYLYCYSGTAPASPLSWSPCSSLNPLNITGSFSATISGFPGSTQTTGMPIAVTTGGVTGTLPAGATVVATNVGTTNGAYCKLGASASTSDQFIGPNGGQFPFTVGTNTQLTCITAASTTTVNMVGGAGISTGSNGGGGGGGGGGTSSNFNVAFPSAGTAVGFSNGTNMVPGLVDGSGYLEVNVKTGGGFSAVDNTAFTYGTTPFVPVGGVYNSTITPLTSGDQGAAALSQYRSVFTDVQTTNNNLYTAVTQTVVASSVVPTAAGNPADVVMFRPDSQGLNPLGPATPANSVPSVISAYNYTHIATSTTTAAIKTGAGMLHTVCVNTLGTVASTITVDDALTATTPTIAVINSLALLGCQTYDVAFTVGLTIVTTGTVAPDVTVSWR